MQILNLPQASFRIRKNNNRSEIYDRVRRRYVALTPEEWVRQNFLEYLIIGKNYPVSLIGIEVPLVYNTLKKRGDIVIWNKSGSPKLIVECKAPSVLLSQDVFHQVAMYNMALKVEYVVVTNGMDHYACRIDHQVGKYDFLMEIPSFDELKDVC